MEVLVTWFTTHLGPYISAKAVVFIISLMPILELRGGLLAGSLLKVPVEQAIPISIIGNILPIQMDEKDTYFPRADRKAGSSGNGKK